MKTILIATRNAHKVGEIRAILGGAFAYLTLNDFPGAPGVVEDAATFAGNAAKKSVELARWLGNGPSAPSAPLQRTPAQGASERSIPDPMVERTEGGALAGSRSVAGTPARAADESVGTRFSAGARKTAPGAGALPGRSPGADLWVLADDSGLEVDALNGAPGVHSARYAAVDRLKDGNTPDADNNAKLVRLLREVPAAQRTARFRCVIALTRVAAEPMRNASPVCYFGDAVQTELFDGVCEGRIDVAPRGQGGFGYDPLFIPNGFKQSFAELAGAVKDRISHRAQALGKLKAWLERVISN